MNILHETSRLLFCETTEEYTDGFFEQIASSKSVLESFICPYCEDRSKFIMPTPLYKEHNYSLLLKESQEYIGTIFITEMEIDVPEVGYAIGTKYWNKGYMTEALKKMIDILFESGYKEVCSSHFECNTASGRVMQKAGMKLDRVAENAYKYKGKLHDLIYYHVVNFRM